MATGMTSNITKLELKLIARINREGPITFRDFMEAALYDADLGYYNTDRLKIGPAGDYYTSSNVNRAFGAVLANSLVELFGNLNSGESPDNDRHFTLIEVGAGTGQLAFDLIEAMRDEHPSVFDRLRYSIVEISPAMKKTQETRLEAFADRIAWKQLIEIEREPIEGIIFSNELMDAMPVHRVRCARGHLEELYVATKTIETPERLSLAWGSLSTEILVDYLERADLPLLDGQIVEINLDAIRWLARLSRAISRGYLITVDYGDLAGHLYAPDRKQGTLRCFHRHRLIDSPLERVGEQDITSSVNFSALMDYGEDCGFETVSFERQTAFLIRMGLVGRIAALEKPGGGTIGDLKQRLAIKNLFVPGGVSDNFRVLIQSKKNPDR